MHPFDQRKKNRVLKINLEESTQINSYLVNRSYTLSFLFFVYICDISGPEERKSVMLLISK